MINIIPIICMVATIIWTVWVFFIVLDIERKTEEKISKGMK